MGYTGQELLEYERTRRADPEKKAQILQTQARYRARKRAQRQLEKRPTPSPEEQRSKRRSARVAYDTGRRGTHRLLVQELKSRPCSDCAQTFDVVCMDFDHRPDERKLFTISRMQYDVDLELLLAEIAKCDVVCANCHRLRTKHRAA